MFALGLDAYIVAGILPNISQTFHATPALVGQSVALFTFCYALSAPFLTVALAKYSAKTALLIALALFFVANTVSAFSGSLWVFFVGRAIAGIGAGLLAPMALGTAAQLCDDQTRGKALGFTLAGMSVGTVVGVPVGLWIAQYFSWRVAVAFVAIIGALALIGIQIKLPKIAPLPAIPIRARFRSLADKRVLSVLTVTFFTAIASLGLYTYLAILVKHFQSQADLVPYFWFWGVGGFIGSFLIGYILDIWKAPKRTLTAILIILVACYALLPVALHSHFIVLGFLPILVWGISAWASLAPQQHTLMDLAPNNVNVVLGLNSSINYLGAAVGAMLGGILISHIHHASLWLPLAATAFALLSLCTHLAVNIKQKSAQ